MQMRIGTRGSALALKQAEIVADALRARYPDVETAIVTFRTQGDRVQDRPIAEFGDKGVFVRTIEEALQQGEVDVAVHSLKDVPADVQAEGLELIFGPREDPRDVLVSSAGLSDLRPASRVGTSSLRRSMELHAVRPDLVTVGIRGNVDTRIRKLRAGEYDAIVLAAAGVLRLGYTDAITEYLPVDAFVPDAGQGTLALQVRAGSRAATIAAGIESVRNRIAAEAERAVVRALGAGCRSPVGAYAVLDGDEVFIRAVAAADADGVPIFLSARGPHREAESLGEELGRQLRDRVAQGLTYTEP